MEQMELFPVEKPKITGYRALDSQDIDLVNKIKAMELEVGVLWRNVREHTDVDPRYMALAKTAFQDAFHWFVRGITKPEDAF